MKLLVFIGAIAFCSALAAAANSSTQKFRAASLNIHNKFRKKHQNTPPMVQDADLNHKAQQCADYYAKKGSIDNSCRFRGGAGINTYSSTFQGSPSEIVKNAARQYYAGIRNYNYRNPVFSRKAGSFTELVWVRATKLGTGYARRNGKNFVVNLYKEHGNYEGKFAKNVKPLKG